MNTRKLVPLSIAASAALLIPSSITATSASWTDAEWVHADDVGTSSLICGQDTGFESTSYGRFLSGSLLGTSLDPVADLEQMTLALDDDGAEISPADAVDLGSTPPSSYVYANPFDLSLLSIVGVNLTGFSVPLPGAALGAANQYARVDTFGSAAGASGLINNSGAVQVSDTTPPADLPSPATVRIGQLLPSIAGIADAQLQVGAVAASSVLDGCAALRQQLWGITPEAPVATRAYGIAGLGLRLDSPAVSALVTNVNSGVSSIQAAVDSLTGSSGVLSNALGAGLDLALPGVLTTSVGGTVTVTGLNLANSVSALLTTPLTDGVVTVDLQSGRIDVDLDALLPSLNNAAPNTEIVLNNAVLNPIVTRVGTLLDNWSSQVVAALTAAVRAATLTIDLDAVVAAPGVTVPSVPPLPPVVLPGLNVLNVGIDFTGTIGAVLDGTAAFTVTAAAAGVTGPINTLLAALGLPTVSSLISTVTALGPTLVTAAANSITTTVLAAITTLGTTLSTAVNAVLTAVGSVVNALPSVLSIMVNVQPDQAGAPPGTGYIAAGPDSTAQYAISALRIGLAPFATPASVATVTLGTASAGPVAAP
jgi:hypothetical protein